MVLSVVMLQNSFQSQRSICKGYEDVSVSRDKNRSPLTHRSHSGLERAINKGIEIIVLRIVKNNSEYATIVYLR